MALPHHDAAHGDQRRGREAVFFSAEQRSDGDVAAGLELAVGLDPNAAAQIIHHEDLLRLGEAELPGDAGVANGGHRRGTGAARIA